MDCDVVLKVDAFVGWGYGGLFGQESGGFGGRHFVFFYAENMSEYRIGKYGEMNVLLLGLGVEQVELAMLKLSEGVDGGRC